MLTNKHILLLNYRDGFPKALEAECVAKGFNVDIVSPLNVKKGQYPHHVPGAIVTIIDSTSIAFKDDIPAIRAYYRNNSIPVLALLESALPIEIDLFDSVLLNPVYPSQAVARISSLIRLQAIQREIDFRLETLEKNFGITVPLPTLDKKSRFNILFVGKASPEFMIIINALQLRNVNVIAAFTSFTAFEYLYEKDFDAVVMNGLGTQEPAETIIKTMRKNVVLFHVPALIIVENNQAGQYEHMFKAGLNDVININSELDEISARIIEQANFYRLHDKLKSIFDKLGGTSCIDLDTKLYNRRFFESHIARLSHYAHRSELPLTLALIRIRANKPKDISHAVMSEFYRQSGMILKGLLRMQDFTARLEDNLFAAVFFDQSPKQLETMKERVLSVLKSTDMINFETGEPVDFEFEITMTNLHHSQESMEVA